MKSKQGAEWGPSIEFEDNCVASRPTPEKQPPCGPQTILILFAQNGLLSAHRNQDIGPHVVNGTAIQAFRESSFELKSQIRRLGLPNRSFRLYLPAPWLEQIRPSPVV